MWILVPSFKAGPFFFRDEFSFSPLKLLFKATSKLLFRGEALEREDFLNRATTSQRELENIQTMLAYFPSSKF